jgi:glucan phosphoethanolaminetransferase (alkaline phosphatase superfamily)
MTLERYLRASAGFFIIISVLLAYFYSHYWLLFTGFVGLNLLQSAFTDWCPMMTILKKLGVKSQA